jgi:hypothetical protein
MKEINQELELTNDQKEAFEKLLQHSLSQGLEFYGETRVAGWELMDKISESGYVYDLTYKVPRPIPLSRVHFSTLTLKVWNHKGYEDKENMPMYHRCEVAVAINTGSEISATCGYVDVLDVFWQQLVKAEDFDKSLNLLNSQRRSKVWEAYVSPWQSNVREALNKVEKKVNFGEGF